MNVAGTEGELKSIGGKNLTQPRRGQAPDFRTGDAIWQCWITGDGQRYVWRAEGDRLLAGKHSGSHKYWARVDGQYLPKQYNTLLEAMSAGYRAMVMRSVRSAG